jgi:hypothetical protein
MENIFLFNPRNIFHPLFSIRETRRAFPDFIAWKLKIAEKPKKIKKRIKHWILS